MNETVSMEVGVIPHYIVYWGQIRTLCRETFFAPIFGRRCKVYLFYDHGVIKQHDYAQVEEKGTKQSLVQTLFFMFQIFNDIKL